MKVKDMIEELQKFNPEHTVKLTADNAPPWVTVYRIAVVEEDDEETQE